MKSTRKPASSRRGSKRKYTPPDLGAEPKQADLDDLTPVVGANLRRIRAQRGLSLERMAGLSGVSRAMLGQIELAQSTPTINILWKIARALDVSFSALTSRRAQGSTHLLRVAGAKLLASADGAFVSRALFPFDESRNVEFYELTLDPGKLEEAEAHHPGTAENLVVSRGVVEVAVGETTHRLSAGDAILFEADVPHSYRNPGKTKAAMYLVMSYAEELVG